MRIILREDYQTYDQALGILGQCKLSDRREKMCQKFARNCRKNELTKDLFPLNPTSVMGTRDKQTYKVQHANTDRLKESAVPYLQRLLNSNR